MLLVIKKYSQTLKYLFLGIFGTVHISTLFLEGLKFIPYIHSTLYLKESENFDSISHKVEIYVVIFWAMKVCGFIGGLLCFRGTF